MALLLSHVGHDHGLHHLPHHLMVLTGIALVIGFVMLRARKARPEVRRQEVRRGGRHVR